MKTRKIYLSLFMLALLVGSTVATRAYADDQANVNGNVNVGAQAQGGGFLGRLFHFGSASDNNTGPGAMKPGMNMMNNSVFGTVTAISGNTITITDKQSGTVYTVDATNAKIDKDRTAGSISSIVVGDMIFAEGTKSGTTVTATAIHDGVMMKGGMMGRMGVSGTVTAISGSTITVSSKDKANTTTTYTVNAANATVEKNSAAGTLASIVVGDEVRVQGTVSGTTVTATKIMDGKPVAPVLPQGNGQPIVGGTVTAVSGSTITITNKSNVSYTIDATNATFIKSGKTGTLSDVAVGDSVVAQGTVNGTAVVASSVTDSGNVTANTNANGQPKGFFAKIGTFFSHIFGF